jgi:hypothetical protein
LAKKFPKTNKKITDAANKKTRTYLFEMVWAAIEKLDKDLTSAEADRLTNEELKILCQILAPLSSVVGRIHDKPKKTPRPRARRKG